MIASSTTQHCVMPSTSESGYVAMAQGEKTALFAKPLLDLMQPRFVRETVDLFEDNLGMAENQSAGGGLSTLAYITTLLGGW